MTRKTKSVFSVICLLLLANLFLLHAGVIPGRWEKVDALEPGTRLKITTKSGVRFDGILKDSDPGTVTILESSVDRRIPKVDVDRVEMIHKARDRAKNGAFRGFIVGAAVGAGLVTLFGVRSAISNRDTGGHAGKYIPLFAVSGAVSGGGMGAAIGAARHLVIERSEVVYLAR